MANKIIEARVIQKVDTEQNWNANELILYKGEIALVGDPDRVYNIKVGNGVKKFRDLPYMVDYINGLYTDALTPQSQVPSGENNVFLVTQPGTYTNFGNVVLPENNFGFIFKNGSLFSISIAEIPTPDMTAVNEAIEKMEDFIDILEIAGGEGEVELFSSTSGLTPAASMATTFNYTSSNYKLMYGKMITKVIIYGQKAGTFSIYKSKNINTTSSTKILINTFNIVVGINTLNLNVQLESNEALTFGADTDTANFHFGINSLDNTGGTVIWQVKSTGLWGGANNNLNIGVYIISDDVLYSKKIKDLEVKTYKLLNKKISFIGDSITTYSGFIPTGNATFYPTNNVINVSQTWWRLLLDKLGANLKTNDSWSGSRVSNSGSGSLQTRLNKIDIDTDVCFIFMGTNDFTNNISLGSLDFSTEFNLLEFTDAYCNALQNLITNYPTVKFICLTPIKRNFNNTFPSKNNTYTLDSMCDRILEICKIYGVDCIDMRNCGINQYNHSTYLFDGLHPNAKGMELIANFIFNKL